MTKKISNLDHESDINHAEQHTRWIFTLLGIWPSVVSNPTRIARHASKLWLPFPSIMILTILIPMLSHLVIRDVSRDELLATLGPISYQTTSVLKNCILISRRGTIKFCIQHMEADWRRVENRHERDIMIRNLKVGRGLTIIGVLGMYGSTIFFNIKPLFSPSYLNAMNESVRPLVFPGADMFVDLRQGFNYEIVYVSNCVCVFFLHVVVTSTCNLAAVFVTHACGQIQIVMSRLDGLVDRDENACDIVTVQNRIAFIVRNHVRVLRFASVVDAFLREMCLMEVACSTLVICWVEYYCVTVKKNHRRTVFDITALNSLPSAALTAHRDSGNCACRLLFMNAWFSDFSIFLDILLYILMGSKIPSKTSSKTSGKTSNKTQGNPGIHEQQIYIAKPSILHRKRGFRNCFKYNKMAECGAHCLISKRKRDFQEWQNSDLLALITYFLLFISLCFNLFIFCHIGELLKEQCQQVGRASYMIDWYKLPGKTGVALVLIITMANYPCQLTAGQMMELSHYSFGSIIKTSFAYLNMLRSMAE